ncbi:MAG: PepSY-associated TM helix domain-containing protein [Novosphingobium sp.]
MSAPRRIVRRIHLWLGLSLGALMVLAGLTGSVLVFYVEIDGWLHPEQAAQGTANARSYDNAIVTLRRAFPDKHGPWRIEVTGKPGAIPTRYYEPPETRGRDFAPMMVWLSPDGQRVLRRDFWGDYAMTWVYDLHYRLLLGKAGGVVFGYAGLALLALLLTGLWVWWPRGSLAKALRFKQKAPPVRRLRDWHKLAGLAGLPLLLMLTATGVMLALPDESNGLLAALFGPAQEMPSPLPGHAEGPDIPPSAAMTAAAASMPRARLAWLEIPGHGHAPYRLRMQQPGDPSRRFPHSFVWIDRHTSRILAFTDSTRAGAGGQISNWLHPLHDGSAGGIVLRLLAIFAGLAPIALFVTGVLRYRLRRR